MTFLPYAVAAWLFLVGLYGVVTSRHLVHLVICLSVVQSSTYVLLLTIGYRTGAVAPVFALCGYRTEAATPLQGALNFAVTNTIGAFLVLSGIALLYGRTGALNMAQIGQALAGHPADGLVI